jgi:hypothetical protein
MRLTILASILATGLFLALWIALTLLTRGHHLIDQIGWVILYLLGLGWTQFLVEAAARRIEVRQVRGQLESGTGIEAGWPSIAVAGEVLSVRRSWNLFDPNAWYYRPWVSVTCLLALAPTAVAGIVVLEVERARLRPGPNDPTPDSMLAALAVAIVAGTLAMGAMAAAAAQSRRLRQSLAMLGGYSLVFAGLYLLLHLRFGSNASDEYELPAGGGSESVQASSVKVQKVVRKKFVINPFSNFKFAAPPPIDQIDVKLTEETANQYKAGTGSGGLGDGDGDGGGFGKGTGKGKIRFIRLIHSDNAWNKNFGIGGDNNILVQYGIRGGSKVADQSEAIDITALAGFPAKKSPPLVYVCGVKTFAPSATDKRVLKQYITERHGMILGDNLGGLGFHGNFVAVMNEMTGVTPVPIPRDDRIHRRPYPLPQFPIVVAHGGTTPLGWKIDGRWVVYYHPGALSDAWRDDKAGITDKTIVENCKQLGINIIFYAHREYNEWLGSNQP